MKYEIPFTLNTSVNPIIYEWIEELPNEYRNNPGLYEFLIRMAPRIYENIGGKNYNPFYKILEFLDCDQLTYYNLKEIKRYYGIDLIKYLTQDNLAEYYVGYPCYNAADLKRALTPRKNMTHRKTLTRILEVII